MLPRTIFSISSCFKTASRLLALSALLMASAFLVSAQTGTGGTILGTVTDASGAVVPNAKVTITNTDTNQSRQVTSNQSGDYLVPDLQIGHYKVRVEVAGFKAVEQTNITLSVGQSRCSPSRAKSAM